MQGAACKLLVAAEPIHEAAARGKAVLVKASARLDFFFDDSIRKWLRHVLRLRDTRLQIRSKRLRLRSKS